jgi:dihydroxyacetone kinase-like protein
VTVQVTTADLKRALAGICAKLQDSTEELDALDAALGDGDLGGTMASIAKSVQTEIDTLPDDLGEALLRVVRAMSRTSGSSFSGVVLAGIMKAGANLRGRTGVAASELPALIKASVDNMSERGGARLGDKSVLDALAAVGAALEGKSGDLAAEADRAVIAALDIFRPLPSKIGRARLAGEVAFKRMIEGIKT